MIKNLLFTILITTLLFACSKSNSSNGYPDNNTIEYRLTATNATNISVVYDDIAGQGIIVPNISSGWSISFTINYKPYVAFLSATADPINAGLNVTVNLKILVNGTVAKSQDFNVSGSFSGQILFGI